MVHNAVDNIMQEDKTMIKYRHYTSYYKEYKHLEYGINVTDLYDIDDLILNNSHKEYCKRGFEIKLEHFMM